MSPYSERLSSDEIRLLSLLPGDEHDSIRCKLWTEEQANAAGTYRALSYVWGSGPQTIIYCNSEPMHAGANLHEALKHLRKSGDYGPLWIDAICINQTDLLEKAVQVRKMKSVYADAKAVIAYLDEFRPEDRVGVDLMILILDVLSANYPDFTCGSYMQGIPIVQEISFKGADLLPSVGDAQWEHLALFIMKDYFSRVWIIQEIISAKDVTFYLSNRTFTRQDLMGFMYAIARFQHLRTSLHLARAKLQQAQEPRGSLERYHHFSNLRILYLGHLTSYQSVLATLWIAKSARATIAVDKIFAMLGLVSSTSFDIIDYEKSENDVHIEMAKLCIEGALNFGPLLLSFVDADHHSDGLPSWVPDWTSPGYRPIPFYMAVPPILRKDFEKEMWSRIPTWHINSSDKFVLQGQIFDSVKQTVQATPTSAEFSLGNIDETVGTMCADYASWLNACEKLIPPTYPSKRSPMDAFLRAIFFNEATMSLAEMEKTYKAFKDMPEILIETEKLRAKATELAKVRAASSAPVQGREWYKLSTWLSKAQQFGEVASNGFQYGKNQAKLARIRRDDPRSLMSTIVEATGRCRRFGVTQLGYLGWFPLSTCKSDQLCVFDGLKSAFVIRPSGAEYRLVGEAFIFECPEFTPFIFSEAGWREIVLG